MNVTFHVEQLTAATQKELEGLIDLHWEEIAGDKDVIKLDPDWPAYYACQNAGQLQFLVARADGIMVGYHVGFVRPHLHYRQSLSLITDIYYLHPNYRLGRTGIQLFKEVEKACKQRGIQKIFTGTKVKHDKSSILERLGYRLTETLYTKLVS